MKDKLSKKNSILVSAYELLSKKGFNHVTVYDITKKAGVNVAAINYYFGSKENLMDMVIEKFVKESMELSSMIETTSETPKQKMRIFAKMLMDMSEYNFHRNMIFQAIGEEDVMPGILNSYRAHIEVAKRMISELTGMNDENTLILKAVQFCSNFYFPMLMVHYTEKATGLDFSQQKNIEQYIDMVIDNLF